MNSKTSQGKRVLIISYYWPPSGGAGVQRWLKFVKYLHQAGWEPIIYTAENPEYPSIDESMLAEVPEGVTVLKNKIWEPFNIYKKLANKNKDEKINTGFLSEDGKKSKRIQNFSVWVRGNFFIPDARRFWIKPSIKYLNAYLKDNPVDYIVSTGPPHSMHLIALGVKKKYNIPWIADFRDPWTNIDFYKDLKLTGLADRKHHRLEKKVLKTADATVTIGKTMQAEFIAMGGKNVKVITNGYDESDLKNLNPVKDQKFSIAHIGSLSPSRSPSILWTVLSELIIESEAFKEKLEIKLVGKVDFSVKEEIRKRGLDSYLNLIPYLNHEDAIQEQMKSHVLLLLINNTPNSKGILTGKMFEYMSAESPILGIGPIDGDAAEILTETQAGKMFGYEDANGMKEYLKYLFAEEITPNKAAIQNYSRRKLTDRLISVLEEVGN